MLVVLFSYQNLVAWNLYEAQLRRFVGQWKGTYTVSTLFGKTLGTYPMEQSYYWLDGHLLGATALQLPDGKVQYEYSEVWNDEGVLHSIVESETKREQYYGWMTTRSMWWQSNYKEAALQQLHTEKLEPTHKGFQLTVNGYQWSKDSTFFHVRAELIRLKSGEVFELLETLPE